MKLQVFTSVDLFQLTKATEQINVAASLRNATTIKLRFILPFKEILQSKF